MGIATEFKASGCEQNITKFVVQIAKSYHDPRLFALQTGSCLERREEATAPEIASPKAILPRVDQQIGPSNVFTPVNQPEIEAEEQKAQAMSRNTFGSAPIWHFSPADTAKTNSLDARPNEMSLKTVLVYRGKYSRCGWQSEVNWSEFHPSKIIVSTYEI